MQIENAPPTEVMRGVRGGTMCTDSTTFGALRQECAL
jgi:hypothetical protein